MSTVYLLCGIFIGFAIISIGLISIFLKSYKRNELENSKDKTFTFSLFISTIRLLKNKYQILIIPLTMFIGFEQAFINADFTKVILIMPL
jgi:chromate transport protein ChrA